MKGMMTRTWFGLKEEPIFAWGGLWRISDEWGPVYSGAMTGANLVAGWLTDLSGYSLAYFIHGGVALLAVAIFLSAFHAIAPSRSEGNGEPVEGSDQVDLASSGR